MSEKDYKKGGGCNADGSCEVETNTKPARCMQKQDESSVVGVDHGNELVMHPLLSSKCSDRSYALVMKST